MGSTKESIKHMSLERKIGRAVLDLGDLVKSSVVNEVSKTLKSGESKISDKEIKALAKVIEAAVEEKFRNGVDGVLRLVRDKKD